MLQIHNMMEDLVITRINVLYDQVKKTNPFWLTCDCENCRMDTVNYVLNRIPPKYVISGRGITHNLPLLDDNQLKADIDTLGIQGIKLISSAKRPYHNITNRHLSIQSPDPVYNFPTFQGNIYDGSTFEPLTNANILLKLDNEQASMMDITWANPIKTFVGTKGTYSFWVKSINADNDNESKQFVFTLEISADGYTPISYSFVIPLISEKKIFTEVNSTYSLKIQDLFLFRTDIDNPME